MWSMGRCVARARVVLFALWAMVLALSHAEQGAFVGLSTDRDLVLSPEANKKVLVGGLDILATINTLQSQLTAQVPEGEERVPDALKDLDDMRNDASHERI